jgi:hypothetical protein
MTIDGQAQQLEASYAKFHRQTSQRWRTPEDHRASLDLLKGHLRETEQCLRLLETSETAAARSKLVLWCELTKATIEEGAARR